MRRLILEEPFSRAALWSLRVGWFALVVTLISIWLIRSNRVDFSTTVVLLQASFAITGLVMLLAIAGFVAIWRHGQRGTAMAVAAFGLGLVIFSVPVISILRGLGTPLLNDVTTDIDTPPSFSQSRAAVLARAGHMPPEPPREVRLLQRDAYPQVSPLFMSQPPEEIFPLILEVLRADGLEIVEALPPGGGAGLARIDAIARTFLLRFPDDVTLRIRPRGEGTRIDIRSASRYGTGDLGVNARRIASLIQEINLAVVQAR